MHSNEKRDDLTRHVERTPLIGKKTAKALVDLGIISWAQLAAQDPKLLCDRIAKLWGKPVSGRMKFNIAYAIAFNQVVEKHPELSPKEQNVMIERLMLQSK